MSFPSRPLFESEECTAAVLAVHSRQKTITIRPSFATKTRLLSDCCVAVRITLKDKRLTTPCVHYCCAMISQLAVEFRERCDGDRIDLLAKVGWIIIILLLLLLLLLTETNESSRERFFSLRVPKNRNGVHDVLLPPSCFFFIRMTQRVNNYHRHRQQHQKLQCCHHHSMNY